MSRWRLILLMILYLNEYEKQLHFKKYGKSFTGLIMAKDVKISNVQ